MRKATRVAAFLAAVCLVLAFPVTASANSAEPPGFIIITTGVPEDASLVLLTADAEPILANVDQEQKLWETCFRIYYDWDCDLDGAVLQVTSTEKCFSCPLPADTPQRYNTLLTLNFDTGTLRLGQSPLRTPLLIALRVGLTLMIEGIVFFLFGFRDKRSWRIFVIVNLITQTVLNVMINSSVFYGGYWFMLYILLETAIFITESIACGKLLRAHTAARRVAFALTANTVSLILGGALLTYLPV